ncbi:flagellar assembly protein FliH [Psychromonas sp. KJ10-10]|uniref:flagellar assembly protein FliH n=1 Tax=Psychromonas sp. KJ10-10 TaxID=3391823 RepID=UPI0039B410F7
MAETKDSVENWAIPDLNNSEEDSEKEKSLFGKPASWYKKQENPVVKEEEDTEEQLTPLTLDDIETIRQSAYEDGFNEGKEAGFAKGLEEGKAEGLDVGHAEGVEKGKEEGLSQGEDQIKQQVSVWESLIERLHNPLEKLDENAEYQLIRLATSLAEQITRCELLTSPQIILRALKQAVDVLPISEQKLTIYLHPDDLLFVQDAYSQEQCLQRGWDLQSEPALLRGDCQIQTQASSIDYTFNSRVEQVLKNFLKKIMGNYPLKMMIQI